MGGEKGEIGAAAVEGVQLFEGGEDGGAVAEEAEGWFGGEGEFRNVGEDPGGVGYEERLGAVAVAAEKAMLAKSVAGEGDG